MIDYENQFRKALKTYRIQSRMRQREVAMYLNVSRATYSAIENGSRRINMNEYLLLKEILHIPYLKDEERTHVVLNNDEKRQWVQLTRKLTRSLETEYIFEEIQARYQK